MWIYNLNPVLVHLGPLEIRWYGLVYVLGFLLGVEHAFEADHMVAISTMVAQHQNPLKAALIGTFWGVGHTTTLFIVGIIVLLLDHVLIDVLKEPTDLTFKTFLRSFSSIK